MGWRLDDPYGHLIMFKGLIAHRHVFEMDRRILSDLLWACRHEKYFSYVGLKRLSHAEHLKIYSSMG